MIRAVAAAALLIATVVPFDSWHPTDPLAQGTPFDSWNPADPLAQNRLEGRQTYAEIIQQYVSGDFSGAVRALSTWTRADVRTNADSMTDLPSSTRSAAAAMVHTEIALAHDDDRAAGFHIDTAHRLLAPLRNEVARSDGAREFLHRWYRFVCAILLTRGHEGAARALASTALALMPNEKTLLFLTGTIEEYHAHWSPLPVVLNQTAQPLDLPPGPIPSSLLRDPPYYTRVWGPAERAYRRALQIDSEYMEARLHLGWVLYSQRRITEADPELAAAATRSTDARVLYLGHLFLGRLNEAREDFDGAAREYERALTIGPSCQTPYIAVGLVEDRLGHQARARELAQAFAAIPEATRTPDPWWAYRNAFDPELLDWLRAWVRR